MNWGFQNYADMMHTENSSIKFDKLNSSKIYDIAHNYRFLYRVLQCLRNVTSKFRTIAIVKSSIKENNGSNRTCTYVHDPLCTSFV
jgi:hypothetical protein